MTGSQDQQETAKLLGHLGSELDDLIRDLPVGAVFDVPPSADVCYTLELVLPRLLCRKYPEWTTESLDGIFIVRARKTGPVAAQLAGICVLISDQSATPFQVDLELSPEGDSIVVYRVMLGEPGEGALGISGPACNSRSAQKLLTNLVDRLDRVDWTYRVTNERLRT